MDEGLKDVLLAILTLAIPAVIAALDTKRRMAGNRQVHSHPVTDEEFRSLGIDVYEEDDDPEPVQEEHSPAQTPEEEAREPEVVHAAGPEKPRMSREEKKKLILYSEIMKPKYDE